MWLEEVSGENQVYRKPCGLGRDWNKRDLPRQSPEFHLSICWLNTQVSIGRDKLMMLHLE